MRRAPNRGYVPESVFMASTTGAFFTGILCAYPSIERLTFRSAHARLCDSPRPVA